jgi:RHS repeat-associated protein
MAGINLSANPTVDEIRNLRLFAEPLVPAGAPSMDDNQQLAHALAAYSQRPVGDDFSALEQYLAAHPDSPWNGSLSFDLGLEYYKTGWYSKALDAYQKAWPLLKNSTDPAIKPLADRAVGELALMNCRIGRKEDVAALLQSIAGRAVVGRATELIAQARETLWRNENQPEIAFRCGPLALSEILAYQRSPRLTNNILRNSVSTAKGCSLSYVADLSSKLGMNYQMAFRESGEVLPTPAVVHWKVGHYAALIREENGLYLLQDPTFRNDAWLTKRALEAETDGYFLVPGGVLPAGWRAVSSTEGGAVWGKGIVGAIDPNGPVPNGGGCGSSGDPCCTPPGPGSGPASGGDSIPCDPGMAVFGFSTLEVSLRIQDLPLGYTPPVGPKVQVIPTYNQREGNQPALFSYSNLGQKWTLDYLAYISDNPSVPAADVNYYTDGGGILPFTGFNTNTQSFLPQTLSVAILTRTSPNSYQMMFSDGSMYVFAQPTATNGTSRNVFMTAVVDRSGNALKISYDSNFRIVALTDAIGQVTTFTYGLTNDILKITKITDPFGRFASFNYNARNELAQITDCIGLTSQFDYDTNGLIQAMTTPYGTSSFAYGGSGTERWLEATFPDGEKERVQFTQGRVGVADSDPAYPAGMATLDAYLSYRNSFFWDRNAYPSYAANTNDFTKAHIYHWLHSLDLTTATGLWESQKAPLENRVWYNYAGQPSSIEIGNSDQPIAAGRVLDDGTTQLYTYQYNAAGNLTNSVDPVGRSTTYIYSTNNVDLLEVIKNTGPTNQILAQSVYNSQHLPLTISDAAGQTTINTYNTNGQLLTTRDPLGETTTYQYDPNGYLLSIVGPLPGTNDTMYFSYDAFGRIHTATNTDGYVLSYSYDNLDRVTSVAYPDGTFDAYVYSNLDVVVSQDRLGRQTLYTYDSLRRLIALQDPDHRVTRAEYCGCGGLAALVDPLGRETTWDHDGQGRTIAKQYADGSRHIYNYERTTSRLSSEVDEKGQFKFYYYYADNNLGILSYPNSQNPTPKVTFTYDPYFNRMVSMSDGVGTTTWSYYPAGVLGALQWAVVTGPFANDTISHQYDALGRETNRTVNGVAQANAYDVLGRATNVLNALGSFSYNYDGATLRPLGFNYPNGQATHYTYLGNLGDHRLQQLLNQRADGSVISGFTYAYNAFGEITNWAQQLGAITENWSLGYDAADQLLTVTQSGTTTGSFTEAYDPAGNRLSETTNGVERTFQYNALNQLLSSADPSATNAIYQWDAEQRLVGIIQGTNQSRFFHDGLGKLLKIVEFSGGVAQTERRFIWSGLDICEEHNANDLLVNRYFKQGEQQNGTNLFYTFDHLGSIRELADSTAAVRAEYAYSPYGFPTRIGGTLAPNFGFTGHFRHWPSGLDLTFYRAYDASHARWISRDPIGEVAGINLYDYVVNDPANDVDYYGDCESKWDIAMEFLHLGHSVHKTHEQHEVAKKAAETKSPKTASGILQGLRDTSDTAIDWAGTEYFVVKASAKHLKNAAHEHVVDPAIRKISHLERILGIGDAECSANH